MKVYIISELCGQWGGSTRRAEQMILQSKMGGADAVKVQLWDTYRMPGENRELWEYLSMTRDQYDRLRSFSESLNIDFFASAFHQDRFEWILDSDSTSSSRSINKIASCMLDWDLNFCREMIETGLETYVSLGAWFEPALPFDNENVKYMHCLSKYPHNFDEAIKNMPLEFDENTVCGYSDHSLGIGACYEAVKRGATVIEKHFTTDKTLQCKTESAHACSMDINDLSNLRNFCDQL